MYCSNCGKELDSDDLYCPACSAMVEGREHAVGNNADGGNVSGARSQKPATARTENAGSATVLSAILPGIGAVMAGDRRGLLVFALSVVFLYLAITNVILMPFSVSAMIVLWIIGISMTVTATTVAVGSPD